MVSDALIIGESWLSEHFFSSDAKSESFAAEVRGRCKEWKSLESEGGESARSVFRAAIPALRDALIELPEAADRGDTADVVRDTYVLPLLRALGAESGFRKLKREGPVYWLHRHGVEGADLAIIAAAPADALDDLFAKDAANLLEPYVVDDDETHPITSVSRLLSHLFLNERVPFAMVVAGRWVIITDRERWPEGRYLAVDLQLVLERNDTRVAGELDRATAALVAESFDSSGVSGSGTAWWAEVIASSKRHSVGVSEDLREGVRLSIEIIANEVVWRRRQQGLEPLNQCEAQPLAVQSLRYLYRILFLLFAEASPELEVLPVGAPEYAAGYSIDRLRDLALVKLDSDQARHSTHLYESLDVLFGLVDEGHQNRAPEEHLEEGLTFNSLRADLFLPKAIGLISEVRLGDEALQRVLRHLLLSKQTKDRDRGFISYADLGINQLGAVYEGLMSYTGFFAEDDLYEVAPGGNASKGSWVVPVSESAHLDEADFVTAPDEFTGELKKVLHRRGTFVYRLSGRARQQSASYYTPEVLTKFVVSQALEELLDQDGEITPADKILELTVCEPALGSGAFAIEVTQQLAEEYLRRKQRELDVQIAPEDYPQELQRVKAYLALHQVYGVDLNATAVELAEISLWLATMSKGLDAPWFGLHLRRGNSLIGARHSTYRVDQLKGREWLTAEPKPLSLRQTLADIAEDNLGSGMSGEIFHFLVPGEGWGSASANKDIKALAPDGAREVNNWRKQVVRKLSKQQVSQLQQLSMRVERLWQFVVRRLEIAEQEIRRNIPIFGHESTAGGGAVSREEIERKLADVDGAYQRLRRVMDAWCALWFWPVRLSGEDAIEPPTIDEWLDALTKLLGKHSEVKGRAAEHGQTTLSLSNSWTALGDAEELDLDFAGAVPVAEVSREHPWLRVAEQVAAAQGFFHWELDFAAVFATRGGFDLQVGNPPWVRPDTDTEALLAEGDPWWMLQEKPTQQTKKTKRAETLLRRGMPRLVVDGTTDVVAMAAFLGCLANYAVFEGTRINLYRCFMVTTWRHLSDQGVVSLIHPDTHFTEAKGGRLRSETYPRLRRHWHFHNELRLFTEVHNELEYSVNVYGTGRHVHFKNAVNLFHPDTIDASLKHDGSGIEPGLKDDDGKWDVRPHRNRIVRVDESVVETWRSFSGGESIPVLETEMVYTTSTSLQTVLEKIANQPRIGELGLEVSTGWNETNGRVDGRFDVDWGQAASWDDVILQGVHIHIGNPFFKSPNKTMKHNRDWAPVDLEQLPSDALPITSYKPIHDGMYDALYTQWKNGSARDYYRIAWRAMIGNTSERTLISAIYPPGIAHINAVATAGWSDPTKYELMLRCAGITMSLLSDIQARVVPKSTFPPSRLLGLAQVPSGALDNELIWRVGRLNCVTGAYAELWKVINCRSTWAITPWWEDARDLSDAPIGEWDESVPLRIDAERRQALVEIDAIVAVSLGITADELCAVYRSQFAVLRGYDRGKYVYDANGRLVPGSLIKLWEKHDGQVPAEELLAPNEAGNMTRYELPFRRLDREAELREAHAYFSAKLAASNTTDPGE